ncbi:unannotated protein [freshwater metagenome]|uniref:Unannotated protein n=1 Tax=freshwater metagenome TaxID=449393 RepID=A0A6J6WSU1_9ZZZZ
MNNGGTNLALDVIPNNRDSSGLKLGCPLGVAGDEDRDGVYESNTGINAGLRVVLLSILGANGEVGDEYVGF